MIVIPNVKNNDDETSYKWIYLFYLYVIGTEIRIGNEHRTINTSTRKDFYQK